MINHEIIETFSKLWWQASLASLGTIFFIVWLGQALNQFNRELLAKIIGILLISNSIGRHFLWIYLDVWNIQSSLPLHLCGLSAILSGVVMFYRHQLLYELLFYWGISGALHSFLTPEFTMGKEGLLFYEYYISHGGIILSAFYLTIVLGMKPRIGSWWKIFIKSQLLLPIIGFINWLIDANYMYLCIKPIVDNPLLIGDWPWYLIGVEFAALFHFYIISLPTNYYNNRALEKTK